MNPSTDAPEYTNPDPVLDVRKREILGTPTVIAVVGMSPKEDRPSHEVGVYLKEHGHHIIPVHPKAAEVEDVEVDLEDAVVAALRWSRQRIGVIDGERRRRDRAATEERKPGVRKLIALEIRQLVRSDGRRCSCRRKVSMFFRVVIAGWVPVFTA